MAAKEIARPALRVTAGMSAGVCYGDAPAEV